LIGTRFDAAEIVEIFQQAAEADKQCARINGDAPAANRGSCSAPN
jgi:hypothetical protein